jgi:arylsulfatase A-like enzyme
MAKLIAILSFLTCSIFAAETDKLNVIVIMADDLGYADLSCTGLADDVQTPDIDRIAKKGIRFTNAYATSPICNASRIGIATGAYQQRQGIYWYQGKGQRGSGQTEPVL